ncbi:hypothetical protein TNCV_4797661 [Trichonephila clavipes]|nr:hypothetical protein TNCV_4797661 [Trichonephila clavipes]
MDHTFSIGDRSGEQSGQRKKINLTGKEELLNMACHVWSYIIPLEYGWWQALNVGEDHGHQHLRDVALPGCSVYRNSQAALEECGSEIQYHPKP